MAKDNKKEAKFFCQSCGSEVPRKSKFCPKCGKFFASVLCPNCGHTGKTEDFINGCPECGYAVGKESGKSGNYGALKNKSSVKETKNIKLKKNRMYIPLEKNTSKTNGSDSALPVWIYISCLLVLAGLVFLLYSCLD